MPWDVEAPAYAAFTFSQNVFGTMLLLDDSYNLKPSIISDWKWDYEESKYILKLDTNLKFHNGRKINAQDFEFSILRCFLSSRKMFQASWLKEIKGITKVKSGMKYKTGMIDGLKVVSDSEIELSLNKPNPSFLYLFTRSQPAFVPHEEFEDDYDKFKTFPIGAGPYKVDSYDKTNGKIQISRFIQYNEDFKLLTPFTIEFYVKGFPMESQFDIVIGAYEEMSEKIQDKNIRYRYIKPENPSLVSAINFSFYNELSNNDDFRQSLFYGLNKQLIISKNKSAFSEANEIIPNNLWGRIFKEPSFDLEKARYYASRVPAKLKENKYRLFVHGAGNELPVYAKEIERQIHEIGYSNIYFEVASKHDLDKVKDRDVVAYIYGLPIDFTDPTIMFARYLSDSISSFQVSPYSKELDTIYTKTSSALSKKDQVELIQSMSRVLIENKICIPLFFVTPNYAISENIVEIGRQIYGSSIEIKNVKVKVE